MPKRSLKLFYVTLEKHYWAESQFELRIMDKGRELHFGKSAFNLVISVMDEHKKKIPDPKAKIDQFFIFS